jgi:hypothetical protein
MRETFTSGSPRGEWAAHSRARPLSYSTGFSFLRAGTVSIITRQEARSNRSSLYWDSQTPRLSMGRRLIPNPIAAISIT